MIEFFIGLTLGGLIVLVIYPLLKSKSDLGNFEKSISNIEDAIDKIKKADENQKGSIKAMLEDFKNTGGNIEQVAREMKNTLITGPGQKQGAWGQMVLEYILDKLEFTKGQQYETQKNIKTEDGRQIPDVIVHFPDNRDVVIDSKVSLTAWDEYVNSEDPKIREEALNRHKISIKNHIDSLAKKDYQKLLGIKSLDSVIMFCPNESAISTLGDSSRKMMEYAIEKKITLVGPAMLYFTLKTVEYYWKAEKQSKNTREVIKLAEEIGSQSVKVYESAEKAIDNIKKTNDGVDSVMRLIKDGRGSLLSKVIKIKKIGGLTLKKKLPEEIEEDIVSDEQEIDNKQDQENKRIN
tara:strand:+ start:247 stop:1296 length:1050 start_codon:yes stop_codon:yes gene_type:complete